MRAISAPTKRPGDAGPTFASAESKIEVGQYLKAWRRTQSHSNLSLRSNSLLTGIKNREFHQIRPLDAILKADPRANSAACGEIP